jgi:hypothetical protein
MPSIRKAVLQGWNVPVVVRHLCRLPDARMARHVFIPQVLRPMEAISKQIVAISDRYH